MSASRTTMFCDFNDDESATIELPCREMDHVVWLRPTGVLKDPAEGVQIVNYWECREGDKVTITNKYEDLPDWFTISHKEVRGRAAHLFVQDTRRAKPLTPVSGENVWRVKSGDRIAWLGRPRRTFGSDNGVISIFECGAHVLALGEPCASGLEAWQFFGAPSSSTPNEYALSAVRTAIELVKQRGTRALRVDPWAIG
jgi:hypothetical protein